MSSPNPLVQLSSAVLKWIPQLSVLTVHQDSSNLLWMKYICFWGKWNRLQLPTKGSPTPVAVWNREWFIGRLRTAFTNGNPRSRGLGEIHLELKSPDHTQTNGSQNRLLQPTEMFLLHQITSNTGTHTDYFAFTQFHEERLLYSVKTVTTVFTMNLVRIALDIKLRQAFMFCLSLICIQRQL